MIGGKRLFDYHHSPKPWLEIDKIATYYDFVYAQHQRGEKVCKQSVHDQEKARRRVMEVLKYFRISLERGAKALDVGCGLGYYAGALNYYGFNVVGIDISSSAIESARVAFPGVQFERACYPRDIDMLFDLIWAVDLSTINSFSIDIIREFILQSLLRLERKGTLVIGWHTDFSGRMKDEWAHWDFSTLNKMRRMGGICGPAIVQTRYNIVN